MSSFWKWSKREIEYEQLKSMWAGTPLGKVKLAFYSPLEICPLGSRNMSWNVIPEAPTWTFDMTRNPGLTPDLVTFGRHQMSLMSAGYNARGRDGFWSRLREAQISGPTLELYSVGYEKVLFSVGVCFGGRSGFRGYPVVCSGGSEKTLRRVYI